MENTELKVITKAMELCKHTIQVTSNCNRYPKKYRFSIVDRMQLISMDIYERLLEANGNCKKLGYEMDRQIERLLNEART